MHGIMKPIQPCPVSLLPIASQELIGKCIWQRLHGQQACATCGLSKLGTRPAHMRFVWYFFGGGRVLVANTVKDVLLVCCLMRQGSAAPPFRNVPLSSLSIPGQKKQVLKVCLLKPWFSKYPWPLDPKTLKNVGVEWFEAIKMGLPLNMRETWVLII